MKTIKSHYEMYKIKTFDGLEHATCHQIWLQVIWLTILGGLWFWFDLNHQLHINFNHNQFI